MKLIRSKGLIFALLIPALFASQSLAQTPQVRMASAPNWVTTVAPAASKETNTGGFSYLLHNVQISHQQTEMAYYNHTVLQPLNSQGVEQISELRFYFYPEYQELELHHVSITRDGKEIDALDLDEVKVFQQENELDQRMYSEGWNAMLILEDVRPNDIISYSYSINGSNPIFYRHDFGAININWMTPIEKVDIRILSNETLDFQFMNGDWVFNEDKTESGYQYHLAVNDIPAAPIEGEYPLWYEPLNTVKYSGIKSWREVNRWAQSLYDLDYELPKELSEKINQWKEGGSKTELIGNIVQFVQDDIRYFGIEVGVNSHLPRPPGQVYKRRFGDCKDKTALLIGMLRQIGVEAYPALVSSKMGKFLQQDLPSPQSFDHVIVYAKYQGKELWIDGTASSQGKTISKKGFLDYQHALVVKPGMNKIVSMVPAYSGTEILNSLVEAVYSVDAANDVASLDVESNHQGLRAEDMRRYFNSMSNSAASSDFLNFYSAYYPVINTEAGLRIEDDRADNSLKTFESYKVSDFSQTVNARKIFTVSATSIPSFLYKPQKTERKSPLALAHPIEMSESLSVNVDGDILWKDELEPIEIKNPWFLFSRTVVSENQRLMIRYKFKSLKDYVPGNRVSDYINHLSSLENAFVYSFWAKPNITDSTTTKNEMKSLVDSLLKKGGK